MKASLLSLLLVLLVASSSVHAAIPPSCAPAFGSNLNALLAAELAIKAKCPTTAKTCSAACKASLSKVRHQIEWDIKYNRRRRCSRRRRSATALHTCRQHCCSPLPPRTTPSWDSSPRSPVPPHPDPPQAPLHCWQSALAPLGPSAVSAVVKGFVACKATFTPPKAGRKMQRL